MSGYELNTPTGEKSCPACESIAPADAVICTSCGLNFNTGMRARDAELGPSEAELKAAALRRSRKGHGLDAVASTIALPGRMNCPNCGYDLTGLPSSTCPECGQTAEGRRKGGLRGNREERREAEIKKYWQNSVLICLIGGSVGAALTLAAMPLLGVAMAHCLIVFGVCEASLFIGCFAMCFFFIGFEEDIRGLALRLLGVGAVWSVLQLALSLLPLSGMYWTAGSAMACVALLAIPLQTMTGRDWDDSFWIATPCWILCVAALTVISYM